MELVLARRHEIDMKKIAVIGAGISGLTCAYELQRAGFSVDVYERSPFVGGRMATIIKDNFYFDIGADHVCNVYAQMKKYCEEFDIEWDRMKFLKYCVFRDGKIRPISKVLPWWSAIRLACVLFTMRKRNINFLDLSTTTAYDVDNAYDHIKKWAGHEAADYMIDAFTGLYQFHRAKEISCGALFGIVSSIGHRKEDWYLYRTKGGMSALPNAFAKELRVKKSCEVRTVIAKKDHVEISADSTKKYDAVVIASTANVTKKIYKNPTEQQSALLDKVRYSSTISVAFQVPKRLLRKSTIFWVPYKERRTISGYVNEAMKGEELIMHGTTLLSVWLHEEFAKKIMEKTDDEVFAIVKKEFLKVCPWVTDIKILKNHNLFRWPFAMPKFYHTYLTQVKHFLADGQGQNNVFFCGDYLNSPWTEGALRCGKRVARRIIAMKRDS